MLLHELVRAPGAHSHDLDRTALRQGEQSINYADLADRVDRLARGWTCADLARRDRVAIYLPKTLDCVVAALATTAAGGIFVPVNPVLKAAQVAHILSDSGARWLVTSAERLPALAPILDGLPNPPQIVLSGSDGSEVGALRQHSMASLMSAADAGRALPEAIDADIAAILYTSGSTGRPKGVVLSHRNLTAGARSVARYLELNSTDRLLAVLPLAFDYGLNQVTSALLVGGEAVLMDYLLPRDVVRAVVRYGITGLAGVPPLWNQLARLDWPKEATQTLRYITNSGGAMPQATLKALRDKLPATRPYLMYGLTEAFRSTYLPPEEIDRRPTSMGKAIPDVEVMVVRPDGSECAAGEPGELVHRGVLVSQGYWADPERTAQRFRPAPNQLSELPHPELAVWSGDTVYRDDAGFLYFVARDDAMIKSSGYRISPEEVEEAVYACADIRTCAALGRPDETLGQSVVLVFEADGDVDTEQLLRQLRQALPAYMVPHDVIRVEEMPHNPNGKIDRSALKAQFGSVEATKP